MRKFRCLVFDDHPLVCTAIKHLIADLPCVEEVFISSDTKTTLDYLRNDSIDLIILDINLNNCDSFDFYRRIKSHSYKGKVLFFSVEQSAAFSEMAFKLGADGYICKSENHNILRDAIEGIFNGYTFFKFKKGMSTSSENISLSERETIVLHHLMRGKSNKEIANILSISDKTVSTYKRRILDKKNVNSVIELTLVNKLG